MGGVPWKDLPFLILNKAISLTAFILLTINFTLGPLKNLGLPISTRWLKSRRLLGIVGFILAVLHVFMSFILFRPSVYPKYFDEAGTLTLNMGLSLLGGVLAFSFLWLYNVSFSTNYRRDKDLIRFITSRKVLLIALLFSGIHLLFMGFEGWLKPEGWHGGMPPISLVGFTFFLVSYLINLAGRKSKN
jgi:DMSO/TMAO reductase YedYZ heme-binding membrane subunit